VQGIASAEALELRKACTLNLGSCYLNLKQYELCVGECSLIISGELEGRPCLRCAAQLHRQGGKRGRKRQHGPRRKGTGACSWMVLLLALATLPRCPLLLSPGGRVERLLPVLCLGASPQPRCARPPPPPPHAPSHPVPQAPPRPPGRPAPAPAPAPLPRPTPRRNASAVAGEAANLKALYRRGQAYAGLQQYSHAEQDLRQAVQLASSDPKQLPLIKAKLEEVRQRLQEQAAAAPWPSAVVVKEVEKVEAAAATKPQEAAAGSSKVEGAPVLGACPAAARRLPGARPQQPAAARACHCAPSCERWSAASNPQQPAAAAWPLPALCRSMEAPPPGCCHRRQRTDCLPPPPPPPHRCRAGGEAQLPARGPHAPNPPRQAASQQQHRSSSSSSSSRARARGAAQLPQRGSAPALAPGQAGCQQQGRHGTRSSSTCSSSSSALRSGRLCWPGPGDDAPGCGDDAQQPGHGGAGGGWPGRRGAVASLLRWGCCRAPPAWRTEPTCVAAGVGAAAPR
jgi:hypothetical protein